MRIILMQNLQEMISKVSLEELSTFVAVVEALSFTEAAKVIGRDATIISRRIGQLEDRLGVRLLSRTTRRVAPTEAGAVYYQRIRPLLDELDSATQEASNFAASPQGLLRVSLTVTFGRRWVAPLLPGFMKTYPNIRVDARFADRYVDVVAEEFDVAIRVGVMRDSSLVTRLIAPFRNLLYASPVYMEKYGQPETPECLVGHSCLGFTNHSSWPDWILKQGSQRRTVRPAGQFVADNSESLFLAAIEGAGIILTPDWLASSAVRNGLLTPVLPGWQGSEEGGDLRSHASRAFGAQ